MHPLFLPPAYQDSAESGRLILRDGSTALVRRSQPSDREALKEFFHRLSPESRRRRFFTAAEPAEAFLARQCDSSNPASQLTLVVSRVVQGAPRIIAAGSYVARDESSAEVAFAVEDEFQGKGLGGLLLERLALLAARHGLVRFWALTRVENQLMLETFRHSGFPLHSKVEDECVEIDFSVAPSADSAHHSETRDRVFTTASLRPFFHPRSVAVIGASRDPAGLGPQILEALSAGRFRGAIHAIDSSQTAAGTSPARLPPGTELAIVAAPRGQVLQAVDDCAAAGVRAVIVTTGGFADADAQGRMLQEQLLKKVRGHGMRMIGPNSIGLINTDREIALNASVSRSLPPRGSVAMSSQSGALGVAMLDLVRRRHLGVSTFVAVGNKADISGNDLLQYWQGDEATAVILLYLESFGNPRRFARIARSVSRNKPIIVVKPGRPQQDVPLRVAGGEEAGAAALLTSDAPVKALFQQTGVIRAETLDEMIDLAGALDRQPLPAGRRVAILSDAEGPGILCADACRAARLSVPLLSDSTRQRIAASLSTPSRIGNPLELPVSTGAEVYARAVEILLGASEVDALIAIHTPLGENDPAAVRDAIRRGTAAWRGAGGAGKPILACLMAQDRPAEPLVTAGEEIPTYAFPESAARVLGKIATYSEWRAGPHGIIPDFDDIDPVAARAICRRAISQRGAGWLSAEEARAVLGAMHLPLVPGGIAHDGEQAAEVARGIGFPVAVKLASPRILHKVEKGAAHLNVGDEAAVRAAFDAIRASLQTAAGEPMPGVLVQAMAPAEVEVVVSMAEDREFGPVIAFGLGGIYVEAIADLGVRVTPLTDRAAAAMVRQIQGYPLLEGYRGHPPADLDGIHDVLLRVSRLVEEVPEIVQLEASPIFVRPPGEGCHIGDARIRLAPPRKEGVARYTTAPPELTRGKGTEDTIAEGAWHE